MTTSHSRARSRTILLPLSLSLLSLPLASLAWEGEVTTTVTTYIYGAPPGGATTPTPAPYTTTSTTTSYGYVSSPLTALSSPSFASESPTGDYRTQYPGYTASGGGGASASTHSTRTLPDYGAPSSSTPALPGTTSPAPTTGARSQAPVCIPYTYSASPTSSVSSNPGPSGYARLMLKIIDDLSNLLRGVSQFLPTDQQTCADTSDHYPDGLQGGGQPTSASSSLLTAPGPSPSSNSYSYYFSVPSASPTPTATGGTVYPGMSGLALALKDVGAHVPAGLGLSQLLASRPGGDIAEEDVIDLLDSVVKTSPLLGLAVESYGEYVSSRGWLRAQRRIELASLGINIRERAAGAWMRRWEEREEQEGEERLRMMKRQAQVQGNDGRQCMACNSTAQARAACDIMALAFQVRSEYAFYQQQDRVAFEAYSTTIQSSFTNSREVILAGLPSNATATQLYDDAASAWTMIVQRQYDDNFYANAGQYTRLRKRTTPGATNYSPGVTASGAPVATAYVTVYCVGNGAATSLKERLMFAKQAGGAVLLISLATALISNMGF